MDLDLTNNGSGIEVHIFSNQTHYKQDIEQIQDLIRQYTNTPDFNVSVAIAVTWRHATIHSPYVPAVELVHQQVILQNVLYNKTIKP